MEPIGFMLYAFFANSAAPRRCSRVYPTVGSAQRDALAHSKGPWAVKHGITYRVARIYREWLPDAR